MAKYRLLGRVTNHERQRLGHRAVENFEHKLCNAKNGTVGPTKAISNAYSKDGLVLGLSLSLSRLVRYRLPYTPPETQWPRDWWRTKCNTPIITII